MSFFFLQHQTCFSQTSESSYDFDEVLPMLVKTNSAESDNMKKWLIKKLGGWTGDEVLGTVVKELYNTILRKIEEQISKGINKEEAAKILDPLKQVIEEDAKRILYLNNLLDFISISLEKSACRISTFSLRVFLKIALISSSSFFGLGGKQYTILSLYVSGFFAGSFFNIFFNNFFNKLFFVFNPSYRFLFFFSCFFFIEYK